MNSEIGPQTFALTNLGGSRSNLRFSARARSPCCFVTDWKLDFRKRGKKLKSTPATKPTSRS